MLPHLEILDGGRLPKMHIESFHDFGDFELVAMIMIIIPKNIAEYNNTALGNYRKPCKFIVISRIIQTII